MPLDVRTGAYCPVPRGLGLRATPRISCCFQRRMRVFKEPQFHRQLAEIACELVEAAGIEPASA